MNERATLPMIDRLRGALADLDPHADAPASLESLALDGFDRLPLPGSGATLQRWQALAVVAEHDLSLAKLYEGHTDALAILSELAPPSDTLPGATWGVWAAEAPEGRATIIAAEGAGQVRLHGSKCWCSGAGSASHALLTAWHPDGCGPQLVRVAIRQPGVEATAAAWKAVGMAGSASIDVSFHDAPAQTVGGVGDYLSRPGFWQGGAGVAACWYGGAVALAGTLRRSIARAPESWRTGFRFAALGRIDLSLQGTAAVLRDAAGWIDRHPHEDAAAVALRARLAAEESATRVLAEAGRALGAAAFRRDARFARAAADLPAFIRQSHGDRDFAALGERVMLRGASPWLL